MKWLIRIHAITLALALLDLGMMLRCRISFRGQWFDVFLSFAPFVTAVALFLKYFYRLYWGGRLYVTIFMILNLILSPVYIAATIWPLPAYAERDGYEVRAQAGMLSAGGVVLIRKWFLFEQVISQEIGYGDEGKAQIRIVFKADSVGLSVPHGPKDTVIYFNQ